MESVTPSSTSNKRELPSQQSKEFLTEALLRLMEKKSFQDITVTEIAHTAGVSRLTFYRNFDSKLDILETYLQNSFETYLAELEQTQIKSLKDALALCFCYWENDRQIIQLLLKNNLELTIYAPFLSYLDMILCRYHAFPLLTRTQKEFIVGGIYFSMLDWIGDHRGQSAQDIAESLMGILSIVDKREK